MAKLRVWNIVNAPRKPRLFPVADIYHAKKLIDALADSQLLDDAIGNNAFGLEVFEDGEWLEWQDDDGMDLDEHFEEIDRNKSEA